jgi:hypothetical protein
MIIFVASYVWPLGADDGPAAEYVCFILGAAISFTIYSDN